jgi:hypothetical protein
LVVCRDRSPRYEIHKGFEVTREASKGKGIRDQNKSFDIRLKFLGESRRRIAGIDFSLGTLFQVISNKDGLNRDFSGKQNFVLEKVYTVV